MFDSTAYADAAELISRYGPYAADEAAQRAELSRDKGNILHFCRWRQAERAIAILSEAGPADSIH